ncbi:MAG TPA: hypothetical protein VFO42_04805 [Sphingomicrobium sp.]|nr:hypothetical protein [Sphingomicrobium sp.]
MRAFAIIVTFGFAAYLILLGLVALADPPRTFNFLRKFAQTRTANAFEAACRIAVGLSFVTLAQDLPIRLAFLIFGWVLIISAIAMLALPDLHRRFADRAVPAVGRFIRPIGIVSLAAGCLIAIVLWPLIAFGPTPY